MRISMNRSAVVPLVIAALLMTAECVGQPEENSGEKDPGSAAHQCCFPDHYLKQYPGLNELGPGDLVWKTDRSGPYKRNEDGSATKRLVRIFLLFPAQTKRGMDLREFADRLKTYRWLTKVNFDVVASLRGLLPVQFDPGGIVAAMRIAHYPPADVAIYFRISDPDMGRGKLRAGCGMSAKDAILPYLQASAPAKVGMCLNSCKVEEAVLLHGSDFTRIRIHR